jgi:hypothetical protein
VTNEMCLTDMLTVKSWPQRWKRKMNATVLLIHHYGQMSLNWGTQKFPTVVKTLQTKQISTKNEPENETEGSVIYYENTLIWQKFKRPNSHMRVYPKVSGLATLGKNCKWYSSLPLGAVVLLFCKSSEFCHHNPLCCFSTTIYCCCCLFH